MASGIQKPTDKTEKQAKRMRDIREIRKELGFSYGTMAVTLDLEKATYQGYDTNRRPTPREVMFKALVALRRNRNFWRGMPKRIDANLKGGACPNEAKRGMW